MEGLVQDACASKTIGKEFSCTSRGKSDHAGYRAIGDKNLWSRMVRGPR